MSHPAIDLRFILPIGYVGGLASQASKGGFDNVGSAQGILEPTPNAKAMQRKAIVQSFGQASFSLFANCA